VRCAGRQGRDGPAAQPACPKLANCRTELILRRRHSGMPDRLARPDAARGGRDHDVSCLSSLPPASASARVPGVPGKRATLLPHPAKRRDHREETAPQRRTDSFYQKHRLCLMPQIGLPIRPRVSPTRLECPGVQPRGIASSVASFTGLETVSTSRCFHGLADRIHYDVRLFHCDGVTRVRGSHLTPH
jgi:hypothetical protein